MPDNISVGLCVRGSGAELDVVAVGDLFRVAGSRTWGTERDSLARVPAPGEFSPRRSVVVESPLKTGRRMA